MFDQGFPTLVIFFPFGGSEASGVMFWVRVFACLPFGPPMAHIKLQQRFAQGQRVDPTWRCLLSFAGEDIDPCVPLIQVFEMGAGHDAQQRVEHVRQGRGFLQVVEHGLDVIQLAGLEHACLLRHDFTLDELSGQHHGRVSAQRIALVHRQVAQQRGALQWVFQLLDQLAQQGSVAVIDLYAVIRGVEQRLGGVGCRADRERAGKGDGGLAGNVDQDLFNAHGVIMPACVLPRLVGSQVKVVQPIKVFGGEPQRAFTSGGRGFALGFEKLREEIRGR